VNGHIDLLVDNTSLHDHTLCVETNEAPLSVSKDINDSPDIQNSSQEYRNEQSDNLLNTPPLTKLYTNLPISNAPKTRDLSQSACQGLQPLSFWEYFHSELSIADFDEGSAVKSERVANFLSVPFELEKV